MLKRSMLKAPPGSKTRVVRSARSLPGASASAVDRRVHAGLARLVEGALEDLLALGVVPPRGVVEDVLLEALERRAGRREGELDVRLEAAGRGAVEPGRGQDARRCGFPRRSSSAPKSIAILRRLGITVSTFSVLSKVAPPTLTRPV